MIFLFGGTRSGKTDFAVALAKEIAGSQGKVAFLAPFAREQFAPEVRARAEQQALMRPGHWLNFDPPFDFAALSHLWQRREIKALILDSLNLWLGHELTVKAQNYDARILSLHCQKETEHLVSSLLQIGIPAVLVSAEVNAGVSPTHDSGRLFRDLIAEMNLGLAKRAELVLQLQCGIATALKYPSHWAPDSARMPSLIVGPSCVKDLFHEQHKEKGSSL